MTDEIYVSTDIEADGPIPGPHSMLSFASAAFLPDKTLVGTYSANLATLPDAQGDAKAALVLIANGDTPPGDIGDSLLVDAEFNDIDLQTVSNLFGPDFAKAAFVMTPGKWEGPVPSGFGLHLVQVTKSRPAEARPFETARKEVVSEWRRQKEFEIRAAYVAKLKEKYGVDIDDSVKPLIAPGPLLGPSQ